MAVKCCWCAVGQVCLALGVWGCEERWVLLLVVVVVVVVEREVQCCVKDESDVAQCSLDHLRGGAVAAAREVQCCVKDENGAVAQVCWDPLMGVEAAEREL